MDVKWPGDGGAIFVSYRSVVLKICEVEFLNVSSDWRGGCVYFVGESANYSAVAGVNFAAAESGGFCHCDGSVFMSDFRAFGGSCDSGTVYVDLSGDSEWSNFLSEVEGVNLSGNEAESSGSGVEISGGSGVFVQFVRLVSNSGGAVLSLGNGQRADEPFHCVDVSGNSAESGAVVYVVHSGSFLDCLFFGNSGASLLAAPSTSSGGVAVRFERCIFDSTTIAAGSAIDVVTVSCEVGPEGEISLDPRFCSPFVTFRPTKELEASGGFEGSDVLRPSATFDGSKPFGASSPFSPSNPLRASESFGASSSLQRAVEDSPKAEGANVFIFVGAGAGVLVLIVVVIVVLLVCRKGDGGTGNGLTAGLADDGKGGGEDSDDMGGDDGRGKATNL
jgi:hypothetical protein